MADSPISRITPKGMTTIPKSVRERLGLRPGDFVRYVITGDYIVHECARKAVGADPFGTFGEWASEVNEIAYRSI